MQGVPRRAPGTSGALALAALLAALLDALGLRGPGPFAAVHWLEVAALAGLFVASLVRPGERDGRGWSTPLDGRVVALLAVLLLAALPGRALSPGAIELRFVLSGVAMYYALSVLVARDPAAADVAWCIFPAAAGTLGLHALWAATAGLERVVATSAAVDEAWHGHHALATALLLATLLTLGRALERGAPPIWRLAALVGATGGGLHLAASGSPFDTDSLARLEDPLGFSTAVVIVIVLHGLGRMAWARSRERRWEAPRWWGVMAGTTFLGAGVLFRPGPPGEGLVLLAVTCGALVVAAHSAPAADLPMTGVEPPATRRRAA